MSERGTLPSARLNRPRRDAIATQRSGKETYVLPLLRNEQVLYRAAIAMRMPRGEPEMRRLRLDLLQQRSASADDCPPSSTTIGHGGPHRLPRCSFRG